MLMFPLSLDKYNPADPERYQVRINGVEETILLDACTATIDPDGRADVRVILAEKESDKLITFICSDHLGEKVEGTV